MRCLFLARSLRRPALHSFPSTAHSSIQESTQQWLKLWLKPAGSRSTQHSMATSACRASVVYVTVPDDAIAKKLSHGLVEAKLAACVNIIPGLQSVYLWQGEITTDAEILLMIKTRSTLVTDITAWVKQNHPYEECEVISTGIQGGSKSYIDWVLSSTC